MWIQYIFYYNMNNILDLYKLKTIGKKIKTKSKSEHGAGVIRTYNIISKVSNIIPEHILKLIYFLSIIISPISSLQYQSLNMEYCKFNQRHI